MLKLGYEISGEMAESIDKLYIQTGLKEYSLSKLKNKKWNLIVKELESLPFEVKEVQHLVKEHLNHPKSEVVVKCNCTSLIYFILKVWIF
jgi:hypothetical protein